MTTTLIDSVFYVSFIEKERVLFGPVFLQLTGTKTLPLQRVIADCSDDIELILQSRSYFNRRANGQAQVQWAHSTTRPNAECLTTPETG